MLLDMDSPKLTDDPVQSLKNVQKWLIGLVDSVNECLCAISTENFTDDTVKKITSGVEGRVEDAEGNISTLQQTAEAITGTVANLSGQVSTVQQTVDGLSITTSGGTSYISGDHIRSGTIEGTTLLSDDGTMAVTIEGGELVIRASGTNYVVGRVKYDSESDTFMIKAPYASVPLKITGNGNVAIGNTGSGTLYLGADTEGAGNVYIGRSGGGRIDIYGSLYINGIAYTP